MICKEDYLKCDKDVMEKALCEHYQELIHYNSKINEEKVKKFKWLFQYDLYHFLLVVNVYSNIKIVN